MSAVQPMRAVTYRAWKVLADRTSKPLGLIEAESMDDAAQSLAISRGDVFTIREDDSRTRKAFIRHIQIKKKSSPQRRFCTKTQRMVDIGAEYPVTLLEYQVDAFMPAEPFDALKDCAVGHDYTLVQS